MKTKPPMPLRASMCSSCPFRDGAKQEHAQLAPYLAQRSMSEASHICHQTGANNAFHRRTGYEETRCRGARNFQLAALAALGFLKAPTDEAWNAKCREMNLPEIPVVQKPRKTRRRK